MHVRYTPQDPPLTIMKAAVTNCRMARLAGPEMLCGSADGLSP